MKSENKRECIDDLKKLYGLPPYTGYNPCYNDGYFSMSLKEKYSEKLLEECINEVRRMK